MVFNIKLKHSSHPTIYHCLFHQSRQTLDLGFASTQEIRREYKAPSLVSLTSMFFLMYLNILTPHRTNWANAPKVHHVTQLHVLSTKQWNSYSMYFLNCSIHSEAGHLFSP